MASDDDDRGPVEPGRHFGECRGHRYRPEKADDGQDDGRHADDVQQLVARVAMALAIFPEPLLHGAHGAESYAAPISSKNVLCKNAQSNKEGPGARMPLMQRFMRFVSPQRHSVRCAPVRAVSAVRAHAHQGAGDLGRLAHGADPAAAQCEVAQSRRRDVWRLPGRARRSDRGAGVRAGVPRLFGVDARHDDFLRSRREFRPRDAVFAYAGAGRGH